MSIRRTSMLLAGMAALAALAAPEYAPRYTKRKPRYKQAKAHVKVGRDKKSYLVKGLRP